MGLESRGDSSGGRNSKKEVGEGRGTMLAHLVLEAGMGSHGGCGEEGRGLVKAFASA